MKTTKFALSVVLLVTFVSCAPGREDTRSADEQAIGAMLEQYNANVAARNVDGIMSIYAPGETLVAFDAFPPRR